MDLSEAPTMHPYSMLFERDKGGTEKAGDDRHQKDLLSLCITEGCALVASVSLESDMRNAPQVGIREERPAYPLASVYTSGLLLWPKTRLHARSLQT